MSETEKLLKIIRDMNEKMSEIVDNHLEKDNLDDLIEEYVKKMWQAPDYITYTTTPTYASTYTTYTTDTTNWRG